MKLLKRILTIGLGIFVLGFSILFSIAYLYEDEIIAHAKEAINGAIDTQIEVNKMSFSLIKDFPNASLIFREVQIKDRTDSTRSLIDVQELSLEFDLMDVLSEKYSIDRISIRNGSLNMLTRADGESNFIFWKESTSDDDMQFDIQDLVLEKIEFTYEDELAELDFSAQVDKARLSGGLKDTWVYLEADISGREAHLMIDGRKYLQDNEIGLIGQIKISEDGEELFFTDDRIEIGKVLVPVSGKVFKEEAWNVDLAMNGEFEIEEFLAELPLDLQKYLDLYSPKGDLAYTMTIIGVMDDKHSPEIKVRFGLEDAEMQFSEEGTLLSNIKAQGNYRRSIWGTDHIDFQHIQGQVPQGELSFAGSIADFKIPRVKGTLTCKSELDEILALSDQEVMTNAHGHIDIRMDLDGVIPLSGWSKKSIDQLNMFGSAALSAVSFDLEGNGYRCEALTTEIILKDRALLFDEVTFELNGDQIELNGAITGVWDYIFNEKGRLGLRADVRSNSIAWDRWAQAARSDAGASARLPDRIDIRTTFQLGDFSYKGFRAKELKGLLSSTDSRLEISPLSFETCGGEIKADLRLIQDHALNWNLQTSGSVSGVDVAQVFREFGQFGQDFLLDRQLRGRADGLIEFKTDMDSLMAIDQKSIRLEAEVTINNGELIEHPSMIGMIDELRNRHLLKPFVRADELEREMHHLKFERLHNVFVIENGVIHIPEMEIANNAMNINIQGQHSFEQQIDYSIEFTLRDILINSRNPEFLIQDDGLGHRIHLSVKGTTEDPLIELDRNAVKENRKEAIAEAKSDIKEFFSNPFKKKGTEEDERESVVVEIEEVKTEETSADPDKQKEKKPKWWQIDRSEEEKIEPPQEEEEDF